MSTYTQYTKFFHFISYAKCINLYSNMYEYVRVLHVRGNALIGVSAQLSSAHLNMYSSHCRQLVLEGISIRIVYSEASQSGAFN